MAMGTHPFVNEACAILKNKPAEAPTDGRRDAEMPRTAPEIKPETITQACNGDISAFNELVMATQDLVYQQAYWLMHNGAAAEDATQEAFLHAFQRMHTFRGGSFKSWIMRITTNACLDMLRRQKRHPAIPLEAFNDNDEEIEDAYWMTDSGPAPAEMAERAEKSATILKCIHKLPFEYQAVIILVDLQEFDYQEAAAILKVPIGTIKSRLTRARLQLRKQFNQENLLQ
ncbi:MAG: RNA polymerase sigma factor [Anaerolineaceae bacterium]|nr:RNA polymerase sigma factor [Anaerolineaceae bacterium]